MLHCLNVNNCYYSGYVKDDEGSEDSMEDLNKKLKKIEKKLRQIELLETKVDEGHTLTAEEVGSLYLHVTVSAYFYLSSFITLMQYHVLIIYNSSLYCIILCYLQ